MFRPPLDTLPSITTNFQLRHFLVGGHMPPRVKSQSPCQIGLRDKKNPRKSLTLSQIQIWVEFERKWFLILYFRWPRNVGNHFVNDIKLPTNFILPPSTSVTLWNKSCRTHAEPPRHFVLDGDWLVMGVGDVTIVTYVLGMRDEVLAQHTLSLSPRSSRGSPATSSVRNESFIRRFMRGEHFTSS